MLNGHKVYDLIPFFNELEILDLHLHNLDGIADVFVIVEATRTWSGKRKDLFYLKNRANYAEFHDRIRHIIVGDLPDPEPSRWVPERYQKDRSYEALYDASPDDIVLVGDCDEIVDTDVLRANAGRVPTWAFEMPTVMYYLNARVGSKDICTIVTQRQSLVPPGPYTSVRANRHNFPKVEAGWHFTHQGGYDRIKYKVESAAHAELDTEENKARIQDAIDNKYVYWNPRERFVDVGPISGPPYLIGNQERYAEMLYKPNGSS